MQITKAELERKYRSMTNRELCAELGITSVTLIALIDRAGIKKKGKGGRPGGHKVKVIG
jgi:hypothetical protein